MLVLIADDDQDQLAVRGELLRHNGFQTLEACDVLSALQMAATQEPSCALIDLCLPTEQDGLYLIRQFKQRYPHMSIFVLTGRATNKDYPELQCVDGVFVKGRSIREVISRLQSRR